MFNMFVDVMYISIKLFAVTPTACTACSIATSSIAAVTTTPPTCGLLSCFNSLNGLLHRSADHSTDHGSCKQHTDKEDNCCHLHDLNRKIFIKLNVKYLL